MEKFNFLCRFCQKGFSYKSNKIRHEKTCLFKELPISKKEILEYSYNRDLFFNASIQITKSQLDLLILKTKTLVGSSPVSNI